jgi:predicted DNA-binding transcriptional regulator YafY
MSQSEYLSRHITIIKRLQKSPANLKDIVKAVQQNAEEQDAKGKFSKRTFQRDIADILALHKINIEYNFSKKVYEIVSDAQEELSIRMLETFEILNSLRLSNSLSQYILFEKRRPHGTEYFYPLLEAIKNSKLIHLTYRKFWESRPSIRLVEGYALKEFRGRWYLVARDREDGNIKTYGLDRILSFEMRRERFDSSKFDAADFFKHCFGIINPIDARPQQIILSFTSEQGNYIKSFPLHESQRIICDNGDELKIELLLYPTYDFIMEILSHGAEVEVLSPRKLRNDIRRKHSEALSLYAGK